ncbi:hypothetical protein NE865_14490 [Phthorimaea operculella]|nr:hypothetical protein NE865_14490 [Phthorimaea operculella]
MVIGKLEPYDLATGKWPAYIRRVNQYIKLNEIKDAVKVSLLITVVGDKTYSLMCDLCSPDMPEDKTYDALVKVMTDHLEPQRSEIAERHVFRQRRQHAGEPLADYLQARKHLAATCNFGKCTTCSTLEINLRDQFVSGLASEAMRSRMFAEKKLDYKKAVELALALEAAEKHAEVSATLGGAQTSGAGGEAGEGLHYARSGRSGRGGQRGRQAAGGGKAGAGPQAAAAGGSGSGSGSGSGGAPRCWRCNKPHHPDRCRFIHYTCDACLEKGHLKVMCRKVRNSDRGSRQNYVSDDEDVSDDMFNINSAAQGNDPFYININIDGKVIEFQIDTGSRVSAISDKLR